MKGIMVPLLIFITTGIVVGQQSNSSNNSFNTNPNLRSEFSPNGVAGDQSLLKPLEIILKQTDLVAIRSGKVIEANIEARDSNSNLLNRNVISGISIFLNGNNAQILPKLQMQARGTGTEILEVGLTEQDLISLRTKQLFYNFAPAERGSYKKIEIYFVENNQLVPTDTSGSANFRPITPQPDESPLVNRMALAPPNRTTLPPFIANPAPSEPGEVDFMGPALPTSQWALPEINNGFKSLEADSLLSSWRADQAEKQRQLKAAELAEDRRQKQLVLDQKLAQWQANRAKTPMAPIGNTPTPNTGMTAEQLELAFATLEEKERLIASKESSLLRKHSLVTEAQKQLALDQQTYLDSIRTAKPYDVNLDRTNGSNPGQHFYPTLNDPIPPRNDRWATTDYKNNPLGPGSNGYQPPVDNRDITPRVTNPSSGINKFAAAIPGQTNKNNLTAANLNKGNDITRDDRVDGFVLFLLLCSLGLNMYLAFISRGFYVRYHELADELRETFSATL